MKKFTIVLSFIVLGMLTQGCSVLDDLDMISDSMAGVNERIDETNRRLDEGLDVRLGDMK